MANGVGSQYSHIPRERGLSSITNADAHTAANSRLHTRPRRFKWTRPFRRKTKSGFCACAITCQMQSTVELGARVCVYVQKYACMYVRTYWISLCRIVLVMESFCKGKRCFMTLSFWQCCPCVQIPYRDGIQQERRVLTLVCLAIRQQLLAACPFFVRYGMESHSAYNDNCQHTYSYKILIKTSYVCLFFVIKHSFHSASYFRFLRHR